MMQTSASLDGQFVILGVGREIFAVPVETVVEIIDMRELFRVPEAPTYLAGLIDVRGRSVPVIDLRVRLGLSAVPPSDATRIIVLDVPMAGRQLVLGLIADRVFEVAPLDAGRIEAPPDIGRRWRSEYIAGVGRRGDSFVVVFHLACLFGSDERALITLPEDRAPPGQPVAA